MQAHPRLCSVGPGSKFVGGVLSFFVGEMGLTALPIFYQIAVFELFHRYSVEDVINTLVAHCEKNNLNPKRTYIWICCLCINQHRVAAASNSPSFFSPINFEAEFRARVLNIGHLLVMMTPWENPHYLERVWCIFEIFTAITNALPVTVVMPPGDTNKMISEIIGQDGEGIERFYKALQAVKIESAEASCEQDRTKILRLVRSTVGYYGTNVRVSHHFRNWIIQTIKEIDLSEYTSGSSDQASVALFHVRKGQLFHHIEDYDAALDAFSDALQIRREGTLGMDDSQVAEIYGLIGCVYTEQCKNNPTSINNNQAIEMLSKCLNARMQLFGSEHPLTALSYKACGDHHLAMERYSMAMSNYEKCLAIQEKSSFECQVNTAETYSSMGALFERQEKYNQSVEMYSHAVSVLERLHGRNRLKTAASYRDLGRALAVSGHPTEAMEILQTSLRICEAQAGEIHLSTAKSHSEIGQVLLLLKMYDRALEHYEKCRAIQERLLGRSHPKVGYLCGNRLYPHAIWQL